MKSDRFDGLDLGDIMFDQPLDAVLEGDRPVESRPLEVGVW